MSHHHSKSNPRLSHASSADDRAKNKCTPRSQTNFRAECTNGVLRMDAKVEIALAEAKDTVVKFAKGMAGVILTSLAGAGITLSFPNTPLPPAPPPVEIRQ